ncbi:UvrD-helicase domain-containing protein [Methylobacillus gramineus]|uniref:UvrD-helicase domain-containing protein n=1 Tax=Methylobacillus gramineus TaxID=755169 RepID=UPI001CFF788D|nr:UvrD-helicase domain-containing protein [Methylobacillus gramineus]MCB5184598.1 UvrD-helicase domain-containing protein [Methylobacillus gramineus]
MSEQDFLLQEDSHSRQRALDLESFIVEAPAGAGKTELLTQRFLRLLTMVQEPEEIIAITFTNKAAAEMRARVLDSLLMAANGVVPAQKHKQLTFQLGQLALQHAATLHWQLLETPSRLRIFTIDSLSSHLARQMPLLSRFGSQPAVSDDANPHYQAAAERTLAMVDDEGVGEAVRHALRYVDNDVQKLTQLLISMLGKRDQWLDYANRQDAPQAAELALQHLIAQDIEAAAQILDKRLQQALMPAARFAAGNLACEVPVALLRDWDTPVPATAQALPVWNALADLLLTGTGTLRKTVNVKNGFPPTPESKPFKEQLAAVVDALHATAGAENALARLRCLPYRHDEQSWQMVAALAQLLKLAVAQLWLVFQQVGEVDFVEVSQRALQALEDEEGTPTELALKLDYSIRHLLVDEFQDTSPGQVKLLQRLTQGWMPDDGRTLFAVGDPMQSIYRFRKANVGLFLEVAQEGIGDLHLQRLQLCRNNRSCPPVIEWINKTFDRVFPAQDSVVQGAIRYREFVATRDDEAGTGVNVHPLIASQDEATEVTRIREAEQVVEIIRQEWAQYPARRIAVLVRARSHLATLVAEIRRHHADLHFQAVEIESLAGRQSVQDLLALTHALFQRADRVNWLAILRAPWCGLSLADLHVLAADDRVRTVWSLLMDAHKLQSMSADGQARALHLRQVLVEALAHQGRLPVSRWLESTWLMLGGAQCLWDAGDIVDVQAYFRLVDQLENQGQLTLERLNQEVEKLYAAPDIHASGQLQFMTIHKSKGLEFDTVILPGLERKTGGNDTPLLLWEEVAVETDAGVNIELVAAPFIPKGAAAKDEVTPYSYLKLLEKERADNEDARVLYVAATRTERSLHLLGSVNLNSKGEIKPASGTFLDLLWPHVVADFLQAAENWSPQALIANSTTLAIEDFTPQLIRLAQPRIPAVFHDVRHDEWQQNPVDEGNDSSTSLLSLEASVGTLVHRYVEMMALGADKILDDWAARLSSLQPVMSRWLVQQGHDAAASHKGAAQVVQLLQLTLQSEDGRWVLKRRDSAAAELAMGAMVDAGIKHLVVDRTFIENGERWIIDYKSTRLAEDADLSTIRKAAEPFRPQLEAYATLFADEGLPIRLAVYLMSLGRLYELSR